MLQGKPHNAIVGMMVGGCVCGVGVGEGIWLLSTFCQHNVHFMIPITKYSIRSLNNLQISDLGSGVPKLELSWVRGEFCIIHAWMSANWSSMCLCREWDSTIDLSVFFSVKCPKQFDIYWIMLIPTHTNNDLSFNIICLEFSSYTPKTYYNMRLS